MGITIQAVSNLYRKLQADYNANVIDVEAHHYGQGALYALIKATQGETYARMWLEEEQRYAEEQYRKEV